ncbi:MAG TPA: TonB-dependent receptor [archaeon]|nr:TonB-dependent receptor [archaeon]
MLRATFFFLLAAASSLAGAEGSGTIRGTVLSEQNEPLKDAQVIIPRTTLGAVTLKDGRFEIRNVPVGFCQVTAWLTGYKSSFKQVFVTAGGTTEVTFKLKERIIPMPLVVVRDTVPHVAVTATIVPMEIEKVPAAVEIITDEKIQEMGALTVADALIEGQSVYLQGDEERSLSASLRGLRTNHTLVLINGRRIAAGMRDNIDLDDIPTAMIQRIEIVRGPSSALYGSDAIGGVINIITKKPPEDMVAGLSTRYGQSKYSEAQSRFLKGYMAERAGSLGYSLFACFDHEGQFDRYKETPWTDGDRKDLRSGGIELSCDLTGRQLIQGGFERSLVRRKGLRPYEWGNGRRVSDTNRKSFFLEYNYVIPERAEFLVRGNYYKFDTRITVYPEIYGPEINPYTQTDTDYRLNQNLNQLESRFTYNFPAGNKLTFGAETRREERTDNFSEHDIRNDAAFLQDIFQPMGSLLFVLGARYDSHSQFGSTLSPKASFTLSLMENLRLKGSYGRGIRAPSIYELYIDSPTKESLLKRNPDLQAEKSNTWEIGLEGSLGPLSADGRFFRNDIHNMINPVHVGFDSLYTGSGSYRSRILWVRPVLQFRNVAEAMSQGFELSATLRITDRIVFSDDATLMETRDKATRRRLLNKPDLLNTAELRYEWPKKGLKAGVRLASVGTRVITEEYKAEGYSLVHLFASKSFGESFMLYGGVNNLLNNDPNVYGFLEGAGSPGAYFFLGFTLESWNHDKRW